MKPIVNCLISLTLCFPLQTTYAKNNEPIKKTLSLSDYILTSEQIKQLKPKEQVYYFSYLTSLVYTIEMLQFRANIIIPSYRQLNSSHFETPDKIEDPEKIKMYTWQKAIEGFFARANEWILPQAHAWVPVFMAIGRGIVAVAPRIWQAGRPLAQSAWRNIKSFVGKTPKPTAKTGTDLVVQAEKSGQLVKRARPLARRQAWRESKAASEPVKKFNPLGAPGYYARKYPLTTASTAAMAGYEVAGYVDDIDNQTAENTASQQNAQTQPPTDDPSLAEAARDQHRITGLTQANPEHYKETGATCLYAGHISSYQADANVRFWCNRPEGIVQKGTCPGVNMPPRPRMILQCNNFGLTNDADIAEKIKASALKETCIPLYNSDGKTGISDLSFRCSKALFNWLKKSIPVMLETNQYDQFAARMRKLLKEFEQASSANTTDGKSAKTFEEYCAKGNFVNKGYQEEECNSVLAIIGVMKSNVNIERVALVKKSEEMTVQPLTPYTKEQTN
ncbi:MAG: hypothetical protein KDD40_06635 [Bdellovibrionales bacterium]|nr:hypothetical protein [Bdellovibrionales bacterium]